MIFSHFYERAIPIKVGLVHTSVYTTVIKIVISWDKSSFSSSTSLNLTLLKYILSNYLLAHEIEDGKNKLLVISSFFFYLN